MIAFSTAPALRIPAHEPATTLANDDMSPPFEAVIEATEEAIYNSLFKAQDVSGRGHTVKAPPLRETMGILKKYGVIAARPER